MKNFFGILFIIILYPINPVLANDEIIKVYYSGFSFSNTYESNAAYAKYTSSLVKEINVDTGIDIISSTLLESIKNFQFLFHPNCLFEVLRKIFD